MKKKSEILLQILLLALCLLGEIGLMTFLAPCGVHEDGAYSTCHWAGQAMKLILMIMNALAVLALALPEQGMKRGLTVGIALGAVALFFTPGTTIRLCMMGTMRCNMIMLPGMRVLAAAILLASLPVVLLPEKKAGKDARA